MSCSNSSGADARGTGKRTACGRIYPGCDHNSAGDHPTYDEHPVIVAATQSGTSSTPRNSSAAARVSPGIGSATLTVTARQHNQRLADYLRVLETPHYDQKIPTERDMLLRKLDRALDCLKEYPSKIESAEQALDAGIEGIGTKRSNLVRSSCSSFNFISFPLLGVANRPWFRLVELWKWLNSRRGGLQKIFLVP